MSGFAERRLAELVAALVLAGLVLSILAVIANGFDGRLAEWAAGLPAGARAWGTMMSRLGESGYLFALSATIAIGSILARARAHRERVLLALECCTERATYVFAALAFTGAATQVVKQAVGRGRPPLFDEVGAFSLSPFSLTNAYASFPSGHSSTSFAAATALTLIAPRIGPPIFILAAAIATSRVVVQAHYGSDVVAGSAFGVVCAVLTTRLFARFGIAFARREGRLALKDPGAVAAGLRG